MSAERGVRIDVFTIASPTSSPATAAPRSSVGRSSSALDVRVHDLRQGAEDARRSVDDSPFGGGAGMVLMPEPLFRSVESVPDLPRPLYLLSPGGRRFDQSVAAELAGAGLAQNGPGGFSLLCGRYEGVDQRVADHLVDGELSVGDYVLAGGELGALVVIDTVARLRPDVLGNEDSAADESFSDGLLEYPRVHAPASFRGWEVPAVLRSGDHGAVGRLEAGPAPCCARRRGGPTCWSAWSARRG